MKKLYFSILSVAVFTGLNAQFSLTSSNIALPGENFNYHTVDPTSVTSLGSPGTGQTYNFSSITVGSIMGAKNYLTPSSTPAGTSFTSSTVSEKDTLGGSTTYSYFTGTASNYQLDGLTIDVTGVGTATVTLTDPGVILNAFPFGYGATNGTDALAGNLASGFASGTVTGDVTTTVDGSGTINILGNSFSNVIRVKMITNININLGFTTMSQIDTTYMFYSPADKFPLLQYSNRDVSGQQTKSIVVNNIALVGMKENSGISFNLFPNPTKNEINILFNQTMDNNASVEVINAVGQVVKAENINNSISKKVDLSGLNAGMYYVRVRNGNATRVEKVIIE